MARPRWRKQLRTIRKATGKRIDHITTNFVTTWTSRGTDRSAQVFRACAIFVNQALHARDHCRCQRAAPTRMDRRKRTRAGITNQYRYAIGRLHARKHTVSITDDHIAVDRLARVIHGGLRFGDRIDDANIRAVNLPATGEGPRARKKLEKATTILQNVLRRVVVKTGKAQRFVRHRADAALTRRKTVYKTVLLQRPANKRAHAVVLAPTEPSFGYFLIARDCFHRHRHYRSCANSRSAAADAALYRACVHAC